MPYPLNLIQITASPMERGTEVSFNVFFRNGVSKEPCNAATSCYQADVYMDDSAGAMTIHGNVMIKDKLLQTKPPSSKYAPIQWLAILINGGADVTAYDNAFLGPVDSDPAQDSGIYRGSAALYEQTCGGTLFTDSKRCGHTGICRKNEFYTLMRKYKYDQSPWTEVFPELSVYNADPANTFTPRCASDRSCPVAAWNQTVVCNAAVGSDRAYAHRAVWPTDSFSSLNDSSEGGKNVPLKSDALFERGNKPGTFFGEVDGADPVAVVDAIEALGITAVLEFAARVATAGEATRPACDEGIRRGGTRSGLAGRFNNPCIASWALSGIESCDPCSSETGSGATRTSGIPIVCAPRDLPSDGSCSCNHGDDGPPEEEPTSSPGESPTPEPTPDPSCLDDPGFRFRNRQRSDCAWAKRKNKCNKKFQKKKVREYCPESCGYCPEGCEGCEDNGPEIVVYTGRGFCLHESEGETQMSVDTPEECWAACYEEHGWGFAQYAEGDACYCTSECPCMSSAGEEEGIVAIVPKDFELPEKCGYASPFEVYESEGYCSHESVAETEQSVDTPEECWAACQDEYNWGFAEYAEEGACYCTSDCPCMDSVGEEEGIVVIVPFDFELPDKCGNASGFDVYKGRGYCLHESEEETQLSVDTPEECWAVCQEEHGFGFAEYAEGDACYCTSECPCMSSVGEEEGILAIVPKDFQLPDECGDDVSGFAVYEGRGYCSHRSDTEIDQSVDTPGECWDACQEEYNREFAEYTDGTCFCTSECPCMDAVGEEGIVAIVPKQFELPGECQNEGKALFHHSYRY